MPYQDVAWKPKKLQEDVETNLQRHLKVLTEVLTQQQKKKFRDADRLQQNTQDCIYDASLKESQGFWN